MMSERQTSRKRPMILVVDDDLSYSALVRDALEQAGFVVEEAADGKQGLTKIKRTKPDLVLLDMMMPRLDGFGLCAELRRDPEYMDLPVLVLTGLEDFESIERAFEVGATNFLTKPISWALLVYHIKYVLRASQMEHELRETKNLLALAQVSS